MDKVMEIIVLCLFLIGCILVGSCKFYNSLNCEPLTKNKRKKKDKDEINKIIEMESMDDDEF